MTINGLGSFDLMSKYNRIDYAERTSNAVAPVNQESVNAVSEVKEQEQKSEPELKVNLNFDGMRRRQSLSYEDISRDFGRREAFTVTQADDQTMKNDMLKAVSDMEKDSSLTQYQYFVGDNDIVLDNEDGLVILK